MIANGSVQLGGFANGCECKPKKFKTTVVVAILTVEICVFQPDGQLFTRNCRLACVKNEPGEDGSTRITNLIQNKVLCQQTLIIAIKMFNYLVRILYKLIFKGENAVLMHPKFTTEYRTMIEQDNDYTMIDCDNE